MWKVGYWSRICHQPIILKAGAWWLLYMMNSNLNLVQPFIILIMRYWKGWDAVNCPNQSKHTESWGEKWIGAQPTLTPPVTGKTILEPTQQSPPYPTIHYTYNEMLDGLRCCEILECIRKHTILVWNVGAWSENCHPPITQKRVRCYCYTWWTQIQT